jgi:cadmium resistance protein CadD (predicted permease)
MRQVSSVSIYRAITVPVAWHVPGYPVRSYALESGEIEIPIMNLLQLIIQGTIAFAATNIDDIFILAFFFAGGRYSSSEISAGQYAGFIALVVISLAGSISGAFIPQEYIGLLGVVPAFIGIKQIWTHFYGKNKEESRDVKLSGKGILTVASVTFANGGDNIGIYLPLFAGMKLPEVVFTVIIFMSLVPVLLAGGYYITKHPHISKPLKKYSHIISPAVFILLGLYIMYKNNVLHLF